MMLRALLAVALSLAGLAQAADYPGDKPIKVIIAYPPGGGTDIVGRIVLDRVAQDTGWRIVIENIPGATGVIGTRRASEAAADGYTMLLGHTAPNVINPGDFTTPKQAVVGPAQLAGTGVRLVECEVQETRKCAASYRT